MMAGRFACDAPNGGPVDDRRSSSRDGEGSGGAGTAPSFFGRDTPASAGMTTEIGNQSKPT
jgi:hypothetical protein